MSNTEYAPNYDEMEINERDHYSGLCAWGKDLKLIEDCIHDVQQGLLETQIEFWWVQIPTWEWWFIFRLDESFHACRKFKSRIPMQEGNQCVLCPHYNFTICGPLKHRGTVKHCKHSMQTIFEECFKKNPDLNIIEGKLVEVLQSMREHQF